MRSAAYHLDISNARADALFASALQRSDEPSAAQIRQAVTGAVRALGTRGCAALVAQAYGEHPETAAPRMRWARATVARAFGPADGTARQEAAHSPGARRAHHIPVCCAA